MNFKIALIQTDLAFGMREKNLEKLEDLIVSAAKDGAKIVCLPESCNNGYSNQIQELMEMSESEDGETLTRMRALAKQLKIYLIVPVFLRKANGCANAAFLLSDRGEILGHYEKTCLVPPIESSLVCPGTDYPVFETDYGRIGIIICNDLCYPEPARILGIQWADVIFVVSAWRYSEDCGTLNWWDFLMRSRAVENDVLLCAVNRVGAEDGIPFSGGSAIVSPDGKILQSSQFPAREEMLLFETSLEDIREMKKQNIAHITARKPELYSQLCSPIILPQGLSEQ